MEAVIWEIFPFLFYGSYRLHQDKRVLMDPRTRILGIGNFQFMPSNTVTADDIIGVSRCHVAQQDPNHDVFLYFKAVKISLKAYDQ